MTAENPYFTIDTQYCSVGATESKAFVRTTLAFLIIGINMIYLFPVFEAFGGDGYTLQRLVALSLISGGISLILFSALVSFPDTFREYSLFAKFTWLLLVTWGSVVILRSVKLDFWSSWQLFNRADGAGTWIIPMIMLLGGQPLTWRKLNKTFVAHTSIAIVLSIIVVLFFQNESSPFRPSVFYQFGMLYAGGFLFVTWHYQKKSARIVGLAGLLSYGFIAFISSWRHGLITVFYVFSAFMLIRQLQARGLLNKIKGVYMYLFAVVTLASILFIAVNTTDYLSARYERFHKKLAINTRSAVITEFVDFQKKSPHLIAGAGALGEYKSYLFLDRNITKRGHIENGYLELVLKGGIIMLMLFLMITLPAALLGIFRSSNWFTRITGILVFGRLIDMLIYGLPWTNPGYILFWLCVGACLNPRFRRMNDSEISLSPLSVQKS